MCGRKGLKKVDPENVDHVGDRLLQRLNKTRRQVYSEEFRTLMSVDRYQVGVWEKCPWPVITSEGKIEFMICGLIPRNIRNAEQAEMIRHHTYNAKSETIFEVRSFKEAIHDKRCLIPVSCFFEFREVFKKKFPYLIKMRNNDIFFMAGIWDEWTDKATGEISKTYSIVTTEPNAMMAEIHNVKQRQPLILDDDDARKWIEPGLNEEEIKSLFKIYPENELVAYTISKLITTKGANANIPQILEEFHYPELDYRQGNLFDELS